MQPMTEKTALALIDALERNTVALQAIQELTAAIRVGSSIPVQAPVKRQVDPAYLPGGVQWSIMATDQERREYKRNLRKHRRKEQGAGKRGKKREPGEGE